MEEGGTSELGEQGLRVIRQEAAAIASLAESVSPAELGRAVRMILASPGKVLLVGSGKSGIAARKIAASFTSTGTFALFLHPVDALHGDLGAVHEGDTAIVVSTSGESEEIRALTGHLKQRHVGIVAITGSERSTLALSADVVLLASVEREAGPLGVAPTTSTMAALAIGDALACVLMSEKHVTLQDFALNHPGGAIGRHLTITVGDLMHHGSSNPTIDTQATVGDAAEAITAGGLGAVSIVDQNQKLRGLLTDGDLRRFLATAEEGTSLQERSVTDIMTVDPIVVGPDTLAVEALRMMEQRPSQIAVLPVTDDTGSCVGLIRLHDIVKEGLR